METPCPPSLSCGPLRMLLIAPNKSLKCFLHIKDIFMPSCVSLYSPFNVYADQSWRALLFLALCPQLLSTVSHSCQDPFLQYSHMIFLSGPSVPFERHQLSL